MIITIIIIFTPLFAVKHVDRVFLDETLTDSLVHLLAMAASSFERFYFVMISWNLASIVVKNGR